MALLQNTTIPYLDYKASEHNINVSDDSLESQRRAQQDSF